jgi:dipeptidyl aminopeptidase/acylaminoacyl peptidase
MLHQRAGNAARKRNGKAFANRVKHHIRHTGITLVAAAIAMTLAAPAGAATNGLIAFEARSPPSILTLDPITAGAVAKGVPNLPPGSANAAWSIDGTMLAFSAPAHGTTDIYVIDADGTNLRPITQDPVAAIDPTWSPDGHRVAYTSLRNGVRDIYVVGIDSGTSQRLTTTGVDQQADWSPDGRDIAFESDRSGNRDIWLMAPDGSNQRRLTSDPKNESDAAWSPNGARIAYSSGVPRAYNRAIYSIARSGGARRQLTRDYRLGSFPAWSPDGKRIVFSIDSELYIIPADGVAADGSPTPLHQPGTDPTWARLPAPRAAPSGPGTVTVATPSSAAPVHAASGQALPSGSRVDATDGSLRVVFQRPAVPSGTPVSTALVQRAEFTVGERTPETLSLKIKPPDCSAATAAAAAAAHRSRRSRVRVKHGHFKVINGHLIAASHLTAYSVAETCRGSLVKVTEGAVDVRPRFGPRRHVRVTAGHAYFVAGKLR